MSVELFGGNQFIELEWLTFPGGERNVRIKYPYQIEQMRSFGVFVNFKSSQDLIDMLLLVNALRYVFPNVRLWLRMPYFPYARQDRVMVKGEALSLQVAVELVKSCNFDMVEVFDPHSDVLAGMFPPGLLKICSQDTLWDERVKNIGYPNPVLVSPDAGALKKIYKLAQRTGYPVLEAGKSRDVTTGNIVATTVVCDLGVFGGCCYSDCCCYRFLLYALR